MTAIQSERLAVFRSTPFLIGFAIRLLLLFVGGGAVFENYFIPFLDQFAQHPFENPWAAFPPEYFPYGLFPLLALGLPKIVFYQLFGDASLGASPLNFALIKFMLLIFDLLLYWILTRLSHFNSKRLTYLYWLNPIIIYISYGLGHFDVISISLIVASLFLLGKKNLRLAGVFAGFALTSKFQVAVILPFIAAYIWNTNFRKAALKSLACFFVPLLLIAGLGFLPLITANHLSYSMITSPEAQRLFAVKLAMGQNIDFLIGFAIALLTLGRLIFSTRISYNGLVYGAGLLLGSLVVVTNAQPGWYFWALPFLALFFANYVTAPKLVFIVTAIAYLAHFLLIEPWAPQFQSISFTSLQLGLITQLVMLYWLCIKHEAQVKNRIRPLMLGLSGDSGAGKNHLCQTIQSLLSPDNCIIVEGDNYHKWERGDKNWEVVTHLNPNANNLLKMQDHAKQIARGQPILHHHYDHSTGRFVSQPPTNPSKTIIFQGLHSLYLKSLRDTLDLRIFLDPNIKVRTFWKIQRDVFERGYSLQKVLDSMAKREADSEIHIRPQKLKSDWVIEITTDDEIDPMTMKKDEQPSLYLKYTLYNDEPVAEILEELEAVGLKTTIEFLTTDLDKVQITVRGHVSEEQVAEIAYKLFPQLRHLTRSSVPPKFLGGFDGVHQLFLLALLGKRMEDSL